MSGRIEVVRDPIAEALDDLAALAEHWTRNRAAGRMPAGVRQALILTAGEVAMLAAELGRGCSAAMEEDAQP